MRCKNITTRCGSMLSVGMRLPRKSRDKIRTLHAWCLMCDGVYNMGCMLCDSVIMCVNCDRNFMLGE